MYDFLSGAGLWIAGGVCIGGLLVRLVRRMVVPEVRALTGLGDQALLVFTLLPFLTGYLAFHQVGDYPGMLLLEELEDEVRGIEIPIDRANVKYLYTINPRELVYYPQDIRNAALVLNFAGESWTLPGFGYDCTNLPMFAGDRRLAGRVVKNVYDKARELGAEKILITECGHAYRSLKFEGPCLAGIPDGKPPVEVVHSVELFHQYLRDGRIRIDPDKRLEEPVTYQDPCNVSRNGGLWEQGRMALGHLAKDFRDMSPNREHNHCCGGGGGLIPMGKENRQVRMQAGRLKAEQIRKTGARLVVAPCHNCWDQLKELSETYDLGVKVVLFGELLSRMMLIPDRHRIPETGSD